MKYQCEGCERLVPVEVFHVEDGALAVTCRACGARTLARALAASPPAVAVSAAAPEDARRGGGDGAAVASAPPAPVPAPVRPSVTALRVVRGEASGASLPEGDPFQAPPGHCPKCVALQREDTGTCPQCGLVFANFIPEEHQPSASLASDWHALRGAWEDPAAHDRLILAALERGELPMVGRLYRLHLARAPHDTQALRGRDEVVRRVTSLASLASGGPTPETARKLRTYVLMAVMVVSLLLVVLLGRTLLTG